MSDTVRIIRWRSSEHFEGVETDAAIHNWIERDEGMAAYEVMPDQVAGQDKWPEESEADMIRLSQAFPEVLFAVYEEDDQGWLPFVSYYLSGKAQHERAVFPPFDSQKLSEAGGG